MSPWPVVSSLVGLLLASTPMTARAEPTELDAVRSQIGWGASINPDRVGMWSEGGWNGGDRRAEVEATVEATVIGRASVFASAQYGGVSSTARPALGAAYQLLDPRTGDTGARISLAYKPEGFTEPEGEIESVLALSRRFGDETLRTMVAYGQDPEGRESDVELGASLLHAAVGNLVVGGTVRYRHALAQKPGEPLWDMIGGLIGSVSQGRSRLELLVGGDSIKYASVNTGIVALVSIGTEL